VIRHLVLLLILILIIGSSCASPKLIGTASDSHLATPAPDIPAERTPSLVTLDVPLDEYRISRGFQEHAHRRSHKGVDMRAPKGTPIKAAQDGIVVFSGRLKRNGYGNHVVIDHGGGLKSLYAHTSKNLVKAGDKVTKGQIIALVGRTGRATGNHLHFEVRAGRCAIDPVEAWKIGIPANLSVFKNTGQIKTCKRATPYDEG
jgi:murein DD-endopeptidase MepM/ murein hydrolase activator NlpD